MAYSVRGTVVNLGDSDDGENSGEDEKRRVLSWESSGKKDVIT